MKNEAIFQKLNWLGYYARGRQGEEIEEWWLEKEVIDTTPFSRKKFIKKSAIFASSEKLQDWILRNKKEFEIIPETIILEEITGYAITDDNWITECPYCRREEEWQGFFDSVDIYECRECKRKFRVEKIEFEDGSYIK